MHYVVLRLVSWEGRGLRSMCRRKVKALIVCKPIWNFNLHRPRIPGPTQFSGAVKCVTNCRGTDYGTSSKPRPREPCPAPASCIGPPGRAGKEGGVSERCMLGVMIRLGAGDLAGPQARSRKDSKSQLCLNVIMSQPHYKISCRDEQHSLNNARIAMTTPHFATYR